MKVVPLLVAALVASAGCGSDPFTVVVRGEQVTALAYRDGDGAWQGVTVGDPLRARIEITEGWYALAWACGGSSMMTHVRYSTLADEPFASCDVGFGDGGFTSTELYGTTMPNARVYVGSLWTSADAAGFYGMFVTAGRHDVIAVSDEQPPRIYVERDVELQGTRELALPVAERGVALEPRTPVVRGTQQLITLTSTLRTRNGDVATFPARGVDVLVPPASALAAGDVALVHALDAARECEAQAAVGDGAPTIELPDAPVPTVGDTRLAWTSDVDWDVIYAAIFDDQRFPAYEVRATRAWMDAAGADALELPDAAQLPGWSPSWPVFRARNASYRFQVARGRYDGAHSACTVNGPPEI